jgi:DNA-binding NarL/FixJ family response regulator
MEPFAVRRVSIPVDDIAPQLQDLEIKVVLVASDPNLRAAATRSLEEAGYAVLAAAHSGHATLACLTSGRVDVLVSELAMDDTSGPALAQRLRRHHPDLRTVYLASSGTSECQGVLVRPFTRDALLREVAAAAAAVPTSPLA